ncbi:MAG TPA: MerR family transcriptional regulator [Acidobacteriaceae bacterium]|jgi:DNA-binding transcriptional MerR regulator|nr:MerR family transcriptional regulator [Acidobacteriaceae bacterium]
MGIHQPIRKTVTPEIPDKLYFRIGDVARLCEVPAYVLRFWETEFPQLKPNKGGTGQRLYRKRDVEMALRIKSLLYDQGYTIPGARQVFKNETKPREPGSAALEPTPSPVISTVTPVIATAPLDGSGAQNLRRETRLRALREELQSLVAMLTGPPGEAAAEPTNRLMTMRPRLVVEPRAAPLRPEPQLVERRQGDLFPVE